MDPREAAIRILAEKDEAFRASCFGALADPRDRALTMEIVRGTSKWRGLIDRHVAVFSSRHLRRLPARLRNTVRVGAYQLLFTGIPQYAAVSATVRCVQGTGDRGYINAVLRAMARSAGHIEMPSIDREPGAYASERYSYPRWIADMFLTRFGLANALSFLALGNEAPPLTLRVNASKIGRDDYLGLLRAAGVDGKPGRGKRSVIVMGGAEVTRLPGFDDGFFVVQDEGATAVSRALAPQPGDRIWDVCAAPGGKTTHLCELVSGQAEILATDIDGSRASMVQETVARLGFPNVTVLAADATCPQPGRFFTKVLVDAPCSGLGVLRRNPDLRWNRRLSDIPKMAARQRALLEVAAGSLLPGGALVYSTCTLTREENEDVFRDFMGDHPELEPEDPLGVDTEEAQAAVSLYAGPPFAGSGWRYILPGVLNDGFFVARAVRKD